ncbi:kinetochore-associated protein NSL1 homolog [Carassius auratus]|uniref:Kinetochore-associated protein NSL1 homolog n=1 Tax=Carassius auratus TaxID=7957 RepID=A0A6P6RLI4_CARAU|nr:kinetochore-associated protein NSL1 homolog [Carassius auratus]XP_052442613.1 kinetochore-associated protein NSL1 homolog [Carassius gibelio]
MEADRESGADFRVNVKSKKHVREQLEKYKDLFKKLLDGQCHISEEDKAKLLQEMVVNFEFTVQENLVIGGLSWDEVSEDYCEDYDSTINDILDEKIVETACKRNSYPKQIRNQVVRSLRAERKLLGLYEQTVKPQDLKPDPAQDTAIRNVSAAAPAMLKQASTVMKSLKSLKQAAEGLRQVLDMQPSAESVEIYSEVFGSSVGDVYPDIHHRLPSTIKRAASDSEYSADYVPAPKTIQMTDAN